LRYFCSPQHTDSAFYPIIGQFERAAGFVHDDTPQTRLDKLDAAPGADIGVQAAREIKLQSRVVSIVLGEHWFEAELRRLSALLVHPGRHPTPRAPFTAPSPWHASKALDGSCAPR
jgi:hypothetical protein